MGSDRKENLNPPAEPHLDYQDQPMMQGYMGIRMPNAPATLTDTDGFPEPPLSKPRGLSMFMKDTRNWKCLRCVFEVPYNPSWGVMSDALVAHYKEQHPDAMPNAPATQGRCADHCVGEACPETDCPEKPVELPPLTEEQKWPYVIAIERKNQQLRQRCEELAEKYKEVAELQLADEASVKNLQQRYLSLSRAVGKPPSSSRSAEHFADILKQRVEAAEKSAAELQQELELIMATEVSVHSNPLVALNDLLKVNTALRLENANLKSTQFWSNRFPCPITTTTIDGVEYYLKHECLRMFHDLQQQLAEEVR